MKSNKILALVLTFAMIFSTVSFSVLANEDAVAEEIFFEEVSEELYDETEQIYEENDEDVVSLAAATELYVSSDYNSSTEGYGTTHFNNYSSALTYASANAKTATIYIEKTTTVSGNCIDQNTHKNLSGLAVVVKDGAVVGNSNSKWDMTYPFTVEPGGVLQSARPKTASFGNTHVKNTLTIGAEDTQTPAYVRFVKDKSGVSYQTMSIAVLYNGKLVANNADIELGDLGLTGASTINNSNIRAEGIVAFGKNTFYKHTLTNSTITVNGHDVMNENKDIVEEIKMI